jgi:RNA polymerase sigma factor (sigma-70 family)
MTERDYNNCVNEYSDNVYRFILKNIRNEEDAKDIVQGAFEKLWVSRENVNNEKCKSYLFTLAYHLMIDHIRKSKRTRHDHELKDEAFTPVIQPANTKRILHEALKTLNDTSRSLVMLKDYEGYSYSEIGVIMGLSESQVKVYLHRARLQLRSYIGNPANVI